MCVVFNIWILLRKSTLDLVTQKILDRSKDYHGIAQNNCFLIIYKEITINTNKMGTQKPGEWANTLIARFEEQVIIDIVIFLFI